MVADGVGPILGSNISLDVCSLFCLKWTEGLVQEAMTEPSS